MEEAHTPAPKKDFLARMHARVENLAHKKHSDTWLGIISAAESIIFPIPVDIMLWPMVAVRPVLWRYYAILSTVSSVAGALLGYLIGLLLWDTIGDPIAATYHIQEDVARVGEFMQDTAFVTTFVGAFSPLPFKVFTLSAGAFSAPLVPFLLASFIGRGLRYWGMSWLIKTYGERVGRSVFRWFNWIIGIAIVVVVLFFILRATVFGG